MWNRALQKKLKFCFAGDSSINDKIFILGEGQAPGNNSIKNI